MTAFLGSNNAQSLQAILSHTSLEQACMAQVGTIRITVPSMLVINTAFAIPSISD